MNTLDKMIIATGYKGKYSVEVFGDIACPDVGPNTHGTYLDGILVYNVNVKGLVSKTVEYSDCSVMYVCPTDPRDFSQRHRIVLTTRDPTNSPEVIDRSDPRASILLRDNRPYSPRISAADLTRLFISDTERYNEFKRTQEPLVVAAQAPVQPPVQAPAGAQLPRGAGAVPPVTGAGATYQTIGTPYPLRPAEDLSLLERILLEVVEAPYENITVELDTGVTDTGKRKLNLSTKYPQTLPNLPR